MQINHLLHLHPLPFPHQSPKPIKPSSPTNIPIHPTTNCSSNQSPHPLLPYEINMISIPFRYHSSIIINQWIPIYIQSSNIYNITTTIIWMISLNINLTISYPGDIISTTNISSCIGMAISTLSLCHPLYNGVC